MLKAFKTFALSSACLGAALLSTGCEINEGDVADARENAVEEQNETEQVREDADREIAKKEGELDSARHTAMRPNYDENQEDKQEEVEEKQQDLEETRKQQQENVREQKRKEQEAKAEAERKEQKLAAKTARDSYAKSTQTKLESIDKEIAEMKEDLDGLKETALQVAETNIELLEVKRENLSDALSELQAAEIMDWKSHMEKVEQALKRFENDDD